MSWIDQLSADVDEAIGFYDGMEEAMPDAFRHLMAAARLVVEGEDIWWCETHNERMRENQCYYALWKGYPFGELPNICKCGVRRIITPPDTLS